MVLTNQTIILHQLRILHHKITINQTHKHVAIHLRQIITRVKQIRTKIRITISQAAPEVIPHQQTTIRAHNRADHIVHLKTVLQEKVHNQADHIVSLKTVHQEKVHSQADQAIVHQEKVVAQVGAAIVQVHPIQTAQVIADLPIMVVIFVTGNNLHYENN